MHERERYDDDLAAELEAITVEVFGEGSEYDDAELERPASLTSPSTGRVLQLEYTPCGVRRCKRCFEGPKDSRVRRDPPIGHGPYYRIYKRAPADDGARGALRGHHVRRDEEGQLEAEFGSAYKSLQAKGWGQWTERR